MTITMHIEEPTMTDAAPPPPLSQERQDLLATLREHRKLFKVTTEGMSDEQASTRSTVSTLTLGGLIKHVSEVEAQWVRFAVEGADAFAGQGWVDVDWETFEQQGAAALSDDVTAAYDAGFSLVEGETLAGVLANYDAIAARTDELVASIDLDSAHPLPSAPWFEQGASWSARRVFLHIIAEMSQHAGHADIIREAIDGAKTMG